MEVRTLESSQKLFIRALNGETLARPPFWLMRQAGRYLPEYRATRAQAGSFLDLCFAPELAVEVTLQPLRRYGMDAAILFSDILVVPHALGQKLDYVEGEGPQLDPIRDASGLGRLSDGDFHDRLAPVYETVRRLSTAIPETTALIGFAGSPWTVACYMVEGGGSKNFSRIKAMALNDPQALHALLSVNTDAVIAYLAAQRAAGAQALQVFDTWGGVLSPAMYREFSLPYLTRIAQELPRGDGADRTPLILFGKGTGLHLEALSQTGADALGLDWTLDLDEAMRRTGGRVALQGNLDPTTLYASPDAIATAAARVLDTYAAGNGGSREGHVFNLGHGMSPDMDPAHVQVLVDAVHAHSQR